MDPDYFVDRPLLKYKKDSIQGIIAGLISGEAILDSVHLRNVMRGEIGDLTFKEVHDKYKWNLNITVTDS